MGPVAGTTSIHCARGSELGWWEEEELEPRNLGNGNPLAIVYYFVFCRFGLVIYMGGVLGLVFHDAFGVPVGRAQHGIVALAFY